MAPREDLLSQNILLAILAKVKEKSGKERLEFRAYEYQLHALIYALQAFYNSLANLNPAHRKAADLLGYFVFSSNPTSGPFSPILSDSFSALSLSGCIYRPLTDWDQLFLTPMGEEYFEKVLKDKFSAEELAQLDQIASDFLRFIALL